MNGWLIALTIIAGVVAYVMAGRWLALVWHRGDIAYDEIYGHDNGLGLRYKHCCRKRVGPSYCQLRRFWLQVAWPACALPLFSFQARNGIGKPQRQVVADRQAAQKLARHDKAAQWVQAERDKLIAELEQQTGTKP